MNGDQVAGKIGLPNRRTVEIECDLTATCDGQPAIQIHGDGDGILRINVTTDSIPSLGQWKIRQSISAAKLVVIQTRQTLEISIDDTPSLRFSPTTNSSGEVAAKIKVLKVSKLISAVLRQLGWLG